MQIGERARLIDDMPDAGVRAGEIGLITDVYTPGHGFIGTLCEVEFHPKGDPREVCLGLRPGQIEIIPAQ